MKKLKKNLKNLLHYNHLNRRLALHQGQNQNHNHLLFNLPLLSLLPLPHHQKNHRLIKIIINQNKLIAKVNQNHQWIQIETKKIKKKSKKIKKRTTNRKIKIKIIKIKVKIIIQFPVKF